MQREHLRAGLALWQLRQAGAADIARQGDVWAALEREWEAVCVRARADQEAERRAVEAADAAEAALPDAVWREIARARA